MFQLAASTEPAERAARVFALETEMAGVHATRVESEDVHTAVSWKRDELPPKRPASTGPRCSTAAGLNDAPVFITSGTPRPFQASPRWRQRNRSMRGRTGWRFTPSRDAAAFLPKAFVDERFNFYGKALSGIPELRPRWQRGMDFTSEALGEAVGKLYVQTILSRRDQSQSAGDGGRSGQGVRQTDRRAHLDVARNQDQSQSETGHAEGWRGLSGPLAGLLRSRNRQRRRARQRSNAPSFSSITVSSRNCTSRSTAANGG